MTNSTTTPRLARFSVGDYALPVTLTDKVMSPALVMYEQRIQNNIAHMLSLMDGDPGRWRPHLKTTKTPEVYALLLKAGLRHFKCATVREARCLLSTAKAHQCNDVDLLLAYPLQGPSLAHLAQLAKEFGDAKISVLTEDPQHATQVPDILSLFVDVNPGMNRTGLRLAEPSRVGNVLRAAGPRLRGLHYYDGHVHASSAGERRKVVHALHAELLDFEAALARDGVELGELITSGTPAFQYALDFEGFSGGRSRTGAIHRVSPGTVVFHDFQQDELLEDLTLEPAAVLLTRVISHPTEQIITCDAGSKSIAAEAGDPCAFAIGHPELTALRPSEEHLPWSVAPGHQQPALGELLYLVPRHICPSVNLAEQALWVGTDGNARIVDIVARGHELMLAS